MKILTANIALGLRNMDNPINNLRGTAAYHSWFSFLTAILCPPLRGHWGGSSNSTKRTKYLQKYENLKASFELIKKTNPDIIVLNEVLPEIHGQRLNKELKEMGFISINYGLGAKYPNAHVSTLVASKEQAEIIPAAMPQLPYPGCGGGIAALRLKNGVSVVGAHMAFGSMRLWGEQLKSIATLIEKEKKAGNSVAFAGDCNETEKNINSVFSRFGLVSADRYKTPTCPTSLPGIFRRSIDHIYVPNVWKVTSCEAIRFGSDHSALCAQVVL